MNKQGNRHSKLLDALSKSAEIKESPSFLDILDNLKKPKEKSLREVLAQVDPMFADPMSAKPMPEMPEESMPEEILLEGEPPVDEAALDLEESMDPAGGEDAKAAWRQLGVALFGDENSASDYLLEGGMEGEEEMLPEEGMFPEEGTEEMPMEEAGMPQPMESPMPDPMAAPSPMSAPAGQPPM